MVAGLAVFALYPLVYLVFLSASKSLLGKTFQEWVGWENFQRSLADTVFTDSLVRSAVFAISVSLFELVFGVAIALLLLGFVRSGSLWRTLILLPLMTPPIVVANAWKLILNPTGGLLHGFLLDLGVIDKPVSYLGASPWAFLSIAIADAWQWTPFVAILAFAALLVLPVETLEAARVDGASDWRSFWSITLPMLGPALASIFLLKAIIAFKTFDLVYSLTFGGPGFDTNMASFQIFRVAFREFDVGYGAAQTIIFGVLVGLATLPIVLIRDRLVEKAA
ncbi:MAG: carbohydrate ABC transporter permease [Chloroflexota bacterium]